MNLSTQSSSDEVPLQLWSMERLDKQFWSLQHCAAGVYLQLSCRVQNVGQLPKFIRRYNDHAAQALFSVSFV